MLICEYWAYWARHFIPVYATLTNFSMIYVDLYFRTGRGVERLELTLVVSVRMDSGAEETSFQSY